MPRKHTWCGNALSDICSNPKAEKALNELLRADDPQVKSLAKDLGVDSGWGRRRRLATHKARFSKGAQRQRRLTTLNPPEKAKLTACKQGVFGVALYGHVAVGLAPKRLKWVRHQHASVLGRMSLGSTEAVIEQASNKHDDPAYTIMNQHFGFCTNCWWHGTKHLLVSSKRPLRTG